MCVLALYIHLVFLWPSTWHFVQVLGSFKSLCSIVSCPLIASQQSWNPQGIIKAIATTSTTGCTSAFQGNASPLQAFLFVSYLQEGCIASLCVLLFIYLYIISHNFYNAKDWMKLTLKPLQFRWHQRVLLLLFQHHQHHLHHLQNFLLLHGRFLALFLQVWKHTDLNSCSFGV